MYPAAARYFVNNGFQAEEQVECRVDHYQTPNQVHVSIFAKQVEKERSRVQFESNKVGVNYICLDYSCSNILSRLTLIFSYPTKSASPKVLNFLERLSRKSRPTNSLAPR